MTNILLKSISDSTTMLREGHGSIKIGSCNNDNCSYNGKRESHYLSHDEFFSKVQDTFQKITNR